MDADTMNFNPRARPCEKIDSTKSPQVCGSLIGRGFVVFVFVNCDLLKYRSFTNISVSRYQK